MEKLMTVLRGIPGAGKSTFVKEHFPNGVVVSADHFFEVKGEYKFDPTRLQEAHGACFRAAIAAVQAGAKQVVVDNTSITAAEAAPYVLLGQAHGYVVTVTTLLVDAVAAAQRNVHGVPLDVVRRMDQKLRHEKLPPWWAHQVLSR